MQQRAGRRPVRERRPELLLDQRPLAEPNRRRAARGRGFARRPVRCEDAGEAVLQPERRRGRHVEAGQAQPLLPAAPQRWVGHLQEQHRPVLGGAAQQREIGVGEPARLAENRRHRPTRGADLVLDRGDRPTSPLGAAAADEERSVVVEALVIDAAPDERLLEFVGEAVPQRGGRGAVDRQQDRRQLAADRVDQRRPVGEPHLRRNGAGDVEFVGIDLAGPVGEHVGDFGRERRRQKSRRRAADPADAEHRLVGREQWPRRGGGLGLAFRVARHRRAAPDKHGEKGDGAGDGERGQHRVELRLAFDDRVVAAGAASPRDRADGGQPAGCNERQALHWIASQPLRKGSGEGARAPPRSDARGEAAQRAPRGHERRRKPPFAARRRSRPLLVGGRKVDGCGEDRFGRGLGRRREQFVDERVERARVARPADQRRLQRASQRVGRPLLLAAHDPPAGGQVGQARLRTARAQSEHEGQQKGVIDRARRVGGARFRPGHRTASRFAGATRSPLSSAGRNAHPSPQAPPLTILSMPDPS